MPELQTLQPARSQCPMRDGGRRRRGPSASARFARHPVPKPAAAMLVVEVDNDYDKDGRVTFQRTPFGRDIRFAYLPGRVTSVSDRGGQRTATWVAN